jgi:glutamine amidotransferase
MLCDLQSAAKQGQSWPGTILDGMTRDDAVYFVHSFAAEPEDETHRLADCYYDGIRLSAAITRGTIVGCQFHPEKSGPVGLRILQNFVGMDISSVNDLSVYGGNEMKISAQAL